MDWTLGLKGDHRVWPSPWPWPRFFKVKYGICYILSQKWSDFHETKSKHIDCTLGLKCDHRVWPWPWPWPWLFKVKYGICYISGKNGPIATKRKADISIELQGLKYGLQFWPWPWPWPDHDHDHLVTKVRCVDLPDSDRGDISWRRAVDSSSYSWDVCPSPLWGYFQHGRQQKYLIRFGLSIFQFVTLSFAR